MVIIKEPSKKEGWYLQSHYGIIGSGNYYWF